MKHAIFLSESSATSYQSLSDKLHGLPKRGHSLEGIPKGPETPGEGWTMNQHAVRKHPSKKQWAHHAVDVDTEGDSSKLTFLERVDMRAKHAASVELGKDWEPTEVAIEAQPIERSR